MWLCISICSASMRLPMEIVICRTQAAWGGEGHPLVGKHITKSCPDLRRIESSTCCIESSPIVLHSVSWSAEWALQAYYIANVFFYPNATQTNMEPIFNNGYKCIERESEWFEGNLLIPRFLSVLNLDVPLCFVFLLFLFSFPLFVCLFVSVASTICGYPSYFPVRRRLTENTFGVRSGLHCGSIMESLPHNKSFKLQ